MIIKLDSKLAPVRFYAFVTLIILILHLRAETQAEAHKSKTYGQNKIIPLDQWLSNFNTHQNQLQIKSRCWAPPLASVGLECDRRICFSNKGPSDVLLLVWISHFENHCPKQWRPFFQLVYIFLITFPTLSQKPRTVQLGYRSSFQVLVKDIYSTFTTHLIYLKPQKAQLCRKSIYFGITHT